MYGRGTAYTDAQTTGGEDLCVGALEEAVGEGFGDDDHACACDGLHADAGDHEPPVWAVKGADKSSARSILEIEGRAYTTPMIIPAASRTRRGGLAAIARFSASLYMHILSV